MRKGVGLVLVPLFSFFCADGSEFVPFAKSFIEGYSFNPESRFAREYHPYLLKKTKKSLGQLENYLEQRSFNLNKRMLIMGYERNAVPQYFNCLSQRAIDDEANVRTSRGWEFAPGNIFGYLTGFLFKDANRYKNNLVEHIAVDDAELMCDGHTDILRKHSFGSWYDTIMSYHASLQKWIEQGDKGKIFKCLLNFWQSIYEAESKNVQGAQFATQDILFSFYYVKHLEKSRVPISKLFVGPDITYPIEVSDRQPVEVTHQAQQFVERFSRELKPIDGKKTAYVFWSFVDGVGKSTLLGNICNWLKYQGHYEQYEHVSNASSQRATLYPINKDITIVDLPAQISHYCAKPDGSVYVDLGFCRTFQEKDLLALVQYVALNFQQININYMKRYKEMQAGASVITPEDQVVKNIQVLGVRSVWRPFEFDGNHYVINSTDPRQVRMLYSFDTVHSQGLKIKEPELMIFDKGLSIPMNYEHFMKDLADQMAREGIENVVFVDFLSMYPRTCRETIRINYLLQQLKAFYQDEFLLEKSIYKSFAHNHELYPLFFDHRYEFERNVFLETLLRWVIHDAIVKASTEDLRALTAEEVFKRLKDRIRELYQEQKDDIDEILRLVCKRVEQERNNIEHYQWSKFYESVSHFSLERFYKLSEMVRCLTAEYYPDDAVRSLWNDLGDEISEFVENGRFVKLKSGLKLQIVRPLKEHELDKSLIESLVKEASHTWYSHIVGLVLPELREGYKRALIVKKAEDGTFYLLRYQHKELAEEPPSLLEEFRSFGLSGQRANKPTYAREWVNAIKKHEYHEKFGEEALHLFIPLSRMTRDFDQGSLWLKWLNEPRDMQKPKAVQVSQDLVRLSVRALATLHMNLKHSEDDVMVRYGNQDDFVAVLRLFEKIMLPKYLSISIKEQLYDDYYAVTPLVGSFAKKD